ncbi:unnamed protein product [Lathyrus oleraceus]
MQNQAFSSEECRLDKDALLGDDAGIIGMKLKLSVSTECCSYHLEFRYARSDYDAGVCGRQWLHPQNNYFSLENFVSVEFCRCIFSTMGSLDPASGLVWPN